MTNPIRVVEGNAKPFAPFWQVRNAAETGGNPEISFYGYISEFSWMGDEITPKKFREDLYMLGNGGPITIRMHSGGGEVFAASAIRSMLIEYPGEVTVCIDGLCASAAVGVALAGDKIKIYDTAYMMVHNPSYPYLMGDLNADALQKMADELRVFKEGLLNAYESRTGLERSVLTTLLDETTWMTAAKAVELGFADEVLSGGAPVKTDNTVLNYVNVPTALLNSVSVNEVEKPVTDGGQVPAADTVDISKAQARRVEMLTRLQTVKNLVTGEPIMNMRQMQQDRNASIKRAEEILNVVDGEEREMTEEEHGEFESCVANAETLSAKINAVQKDRERLQALVSGVSAVDSEPELPNAAFVEKRMKREQFDALNSAERAAYVRGGGRIED